MEHNIYCIFVSIQKLQSYYWIWDLLVYFVCNRRCIGISPGIEKFTNSIEDFIIGQRNVNYYTLLLLSYALFRLSLHIDRCAKFACSMITIFFT